VSIESHARRLGAQARRRRPSEPEPDVSTLSPADVVFRSVKKHGHRTLALRAAARMEARALEAGAPTGPLALPRTEAAPAADAKPSAPVETKKPAPPPPKSIQEQWVEEHCWWRPRGASDYDDDDDLKPYMTIHDYDPLDTDE